MKLKLFFSIVLFLLAFYFSSSQAGQAANSSDVVINEIAWMGTANSANDEWTELYNNTSNNINLDGWLLKSVDGTPEIKLTGIISANSFFLLERTDNETVPGVAADQIYKGALGNSGEILELYDGSGSLIDRIDCGSGWFSGDNATKQTMERKNTLTSSSDSSDWQTSQNPGGTPKAKNSSKIETVPQSPTKSEATDNSKTTDLSSESSTGLDQVVCLSGIIINEILPSPAGQDSVEEWIELFNQNNFEVDLSGWKIKDTTGKTTTYTFPKDTKISSQGFLVLPRGKTKITLNNDEDGLILASPDGKTADEASYEKAPQGKSYNRVNSEWVWSANLTPGAPNATEKTADQSPEDKERIELATVGEQAPKASKLSLVLLSAFAIAIFSGVIILTLKKKLRNIASLQK